MTVGQIMEATGLGRASVHSYLPYHKLPYNMKELSANAERIRLYRERKALCEKFAQRLVGLATEEQNAALWEALEHLQGCIFYTSKSQKYTYKIENKRLIVNQTEEAIAQAAVFAAFQMAVKPEPGAADQERIKSSAALYLYPVFDRLGVGKGC